MARIVLYKEQFLLIIKYTELGNIWQRIIDYIKQSINLVAYFRYVTKTLKI